MKVSSAVRRKAIGNMVALAGICGVTKQAVHKWLRRNDRIPKHHINKVRQVLSQQSQNAGGRGR